jgi:hypothetical protein
MPESAAAKAADGKAPLDDLMLAMDVVDTLRHRASLVERELNTEARDQQLIERLREIYRAQGIDVPDSVLAEGVTALKEDRFRYTPPPESFSVKLARIYVCRKRCLGLAAAAWLCYALLVSAPRRRLLAELPNQIASQEASVVQAAYIDKAKEEARSIASKAQRALDEGDISGAQKGLDELKDLRDRLTGSSRNTSCASSPREALESGASPTSTRRRATTTSSCSRWQRTERF